MASDVNMVIQVGRLTKDAEIKDVGDRVVATFPIACNYHAPGRADTVNYFDVELWHPGGLSPYLKQGKQLVVQGELRQERWADSTGVNRSRIKILAKTVQLVGGAHADA